MISEILIFGLAGLAMLICLVEHGRPQRAEAVLCFTAMALPMLWPAPGVLPVGLAMLLAIGLRPLMFGPYYDIMVWHRALSSLSMAAVMWLGAEMTVLVLGAPSLGMCGKMPGLKMPDTVASGMAVAEGTWLNILLALVIVSYGLASLVCAGRVLAIRMPHARFHAVEIAAMLSATIGMAYAM